MDLRKFDIKDLLDSYSRREFKPSEVITAVLAKIEENDPRLKAFLEVREDEVKRRAASLDERTSEFGKLPLYGIPIAVKDNFLVKGWKATAGSKILHDYISPFTATCIERLEAAGAIIVGKTNLDEFAMGSSTENSAFGPSRNPWDLDRVPGGSSGGSAVAVAAAMSAGALGTDTGGSIRQPASLCGVVGMKPSYGRVSRYGIIAYASSLDQVGPFGRSVWDVARQLEVMAGYDGKDATSSRSVVPRYTETLSNASLRGVTIGVVKEWGKDLVGEVAVNFQKTMDLLAKEGAKLVEITLPHTKAALSTYYLLAPSEASSNLARYDGIRYGYRSSQSESIDDVYQRSRGEGFGAEVKLRIMLGTYALSAGYYDAFYLKANQVRRLIQRDFEEAFKKCQILVSPTSPSTAFRFGEKTDDPVTMYLSDIFTLPVNLAGLPGLSLPCGLDSQSLPMGLQFIGKFFDEASVLSTAAAYERIRGPFPLSPVLAKEKQ